MRLILAVLYTAGSAAITYIDNELPQNKFAVVVHSPDDISVQEQTAQKTAPDGTIVDASNVALFAGQPTLMSLVLFKGYNFTYETGVLAAGLSQQKPTRQQLGGSAACATNLKTGSSNLFTEWTFYQFNPFFQFMGQTLEAIQGYITAPMAGEYTLCYSSDGSFDSDRASFTEVKMNVSGIYKDCGHKDCLQDTNILNCSMSREFDEAHRCVDSVLDAEFQGGDGSDFSEGADRRILAPGFSYETGLQYGLEAAVGGCPPATAMPKTFTNVSRPFGSDTIAFTLNDTCPRATGF
jgi:hypothetical protein